MDHFNRHLSPDCVLHIFSRLPIRELVVAGLVCTRWNDFHSTSLRSRQSLTILLDQSQYMDMYDPVLRLSTDLSNSSCFAGLLEPLPKSKVEFNLLIYPSLTLVKVNRLSELFPRVTKLQLAIYETEPLSRLSYERLLESWQLIRLEIYSTYCTLVSYEPQNFLSSDEIFRKDKENVQIHRALLAKVNQLSSLKKFIYIVDRRIASISRDGVRWEPLDLPILGQLEEFKFQTLDCSSVLLNSLHDYGLPNAQLRVIDLGLFRKLGSLFELPNAQDLIARFTTLKLPQYGFNKDIDWPQFHRLSSCLVALSTCSIAISSDQNYPELITSLTHLQQLTTLEIHVMYGLLNQDPLNFTDATLPSVKHLLFPGSLQPNCHMNLVKHFQLERVFPCLRLLYTPISIGLCEICEMGFTYSEEPISREQGQRCAQRRVAGFSGLDQNRIKVKCTFQFLCANWHDGTGYCSHRKLWTCEQLGVQI